MSAHYLVYFIAIVQFRIHQNRWIKNLNAKDVSVQGWPQAEEKYSQIPAGKC